MIDNDQITALAREYAEEIRPYNDKNAPLSILDIRAAKRLIHFLLRRYCLVEKGKVEGEYRVAKELLDKVPALSIIGSVINGQIIALDSLFPEIAKEVEE